MGKTHRKNVVVSGSKKEEREIKKQLRKKNQKEKNYSSHEELKFQELMESKGLRIKLMGGDGNCMFRSIADQLTGDEGNHSEFRHRIMNYIAANESHFSLFMEDDESFPDYMARMRRDAEWGGQPELYAAAQCLQTNIFVHQIDGPRFVIQRDAENGSFENNSCARDIHLSYHGGCHYNSVRNKTDSAGAASHIDLTSSNNNNNNNNNKSERSKLVSRVKNSVGWMSESDIDRALQLSGDDIDRAVEFLIFTPELLEQNEEKEEKEKEEKEEKEKEKKEEKEEKEKKEKENGKAADSKIEESNVSELNMNEININEINSKASPALIETATTGEGKENTKKTKKKEKIKSKVEENKTVCKPMSKKDKRLALKKSEQETNDLKKDKERKDRKESSSSGVGLDGILEIVL